VHVSGTCRVGGGAGPHQAGVVRALVRNDAKIFLRLPYAQMDVPLVDRAVKVSPLLKAADLQVLRQQVSRQLYRENTA
jgi:hypothetical protein